MGNEIDQTPDGLEKSDITPEGLEGVTQRLDNRLPAVVQDCLPKSVEHCMLQMVERYLNEHLPVTVHHLVPEIRLQLSRIGGSPTVNNVEQYFVTPDIYKAFHKTLEIPVKYKNNISVIPC